MRCETGDHVIFKSVLPGLVGQAMRQSNRAFYFDHLWLPKNPELLRQRPGTRMHPTGLCGKQICSGILVLTDTIEQSDAGIPQQRPRMPMALPSPHASKRENHPAPSTASIAYTRYGQIEALILLAGAGHALLASDAPAPATAPPTAPCCHFQPDG